MSDRSISPQLLASGLAARLIHDISGLAYGITSGIDLHAESGPAELKDEAFALTASSAEALTQLLSYFRVAFGADGAPQTCDALEALALTQFVGRRARLEWRPTVQVFTGPGSQALLILAQVAAGALPTGGAARVTAEHGRGETIIVVESQGAPATVFPEVLEGLAGKPLTSGFAGRWAPARYMRAIIDAAGGRVRWNIDPERLVLEVALPD